MYIILYTYWWRTEEEEERVRELGREGDGIKTDIGCAQQLLNVIGH